MHIITQNSAETSLWNRTLKALHPLGSNCIHHNVSTSKKGFDIRICIYSIIQSHKKTVHVQETKLVLNCHSEQKAKTDIFYNHFSLPKSIINDLKTLLLFDLLDN